MTLRELVERAHSIAREKGFWDRPKEFGTLMALIHSELSEALEAHRCGAGKEAIAEELADCVIWIADVCGGLGIDLEAAVARKLLINAGRPRLHDKAY